MFNLTLPEIMKQQRSYSIYSYINYIYVQVLINLLTELSIFMKAECKHKDLVPKLFSS